MEKMKKEPSCKWLSIYDMVKNVDCLFQRAKGLQKGNDTMHCVLKEAWVTGVASMGPFLTFLG